MIKSTKDLIKILPFDDQFKNGLLEKYDSLDIDQKYNIDGALWDLYDALYAIKLEENIQLALQDKTSTEKLDETFYKRMKEKTEKEMQTEHVSVATDVDLTAARAKLQSLMAPEEKN